MRSGGGGGGGGGEGFVVGVEVGGGVVGWEVLGEGPGFVGWGWSWMSGFGVMRGEGEGAGEGGGEIGALGGG